MEGCPAVIVAGGESTERGVNSKQEHSARRRGARPLARPGYLQSAPALFWLSDCPCVRFPNGSIVSKTDFEVNLILFECYLFCSCVFNHKLLVTRIHLCHFQYTLAFLRRKCRPV